MRRQSDHVAERAQEVIGAHAPLRARARSSCQRLCGEASIRRSAAGDALLVARAEAPPVDRAVPRCKANGRRRAAAPVSSKAPVVSASRAASAAAMRGVSGGSGGRPRCVKKARDRARRASRRPAARRSRARNGRREQRSPRACSCPHSKQAPALPSRSAPGASVAPPWRVRYWKLPCGHRGDADTAACCSSNGAVAPGRASQTTSRTRQPAPDASRCVAMTWQKSRAARCHARGNRNFSQASDARGRLAGPAERKLAMIRTVTAFSALLSDRPRRAIAPTRWASMAG